MDNVIDRLAIQDVMLKYAAGVDERNRELYGQCFCEDVEVVNFGSTTINGKSAWVAYVWDALSDYQSTQHLLSPVLADIDHDTATAHCNVQASHVLTGGGRLTLLARYQSQLRREQGVWRISRHELIVRDMIQT